MGFSCRHLGELPNGRPRRHVQCSTVQWTIIPQLAPQPWIACSGCGGPKPFESSGKTRLNANGKKLDAWLIYRCLACEKTWNRSIFERRNVRSIDRSVLEAMQSSDREWIRVLEFDVAALRREAQRVDEFPTSMFPERSSATAAEIQPNSKSSWLPRFRQAYGWIVCLRQNCPCPGRNCTSFMPRQGCASIRTTRMHCDGGSGIEPL